jgi:hypothetical protein
MGGTRKRRYRRNAPNQSISTIKTVRIIENSMLYLSPIGAGLHLVMVLLKPSSKTPIFLIRGKEPRYRRNASNQSISTIRTVRIIEDTPFYLSPIGASPYLPRVLLNIKLTIVKILDEEITRNQRKVSNQATSTIRIIPMLANTLIYSSPIGANLL